MSLKDRNPSLDGLRGMAILLVLLHHFFKLPGGWAGVDIFFVLSGFLITTILRNDRCERHFWSIYFARRTTRILPPFLLLMLVAVLTVPLAWSRIWPYYAFFGANFASYRFGEGVGPLTALWSLAIEEHFYFVWPTVVRRTSDRTLALVALLVLLLEPMIRLAAWFHGVHDWQAYYSLTPYRLDGLALGALLSVAVSLPQSRSWLERTIQPALWTLLAISAVCFGLLHLDRISHPLFFALAGYLLLSLVGGAFLVQLVFNPTGWLGHAFSWTPLRWLGGISYGFYIYHELVIYQVNRIFAHWGIAHMRSFVSLPISLFLAWLSFRYLETPILNAGRRLVAERKRDTAAIERAVN